MGDMWAKDWKLSPEGVKYLNKLRELQTKEVVIGIQRGDYVYKADDDSSKVNTGKSKQKDIDLVDVAVINELGTSDGHIPARPFLKQSFENRQQYILDAEKKALEGLLANDTPEKCLSIIGVATTAAVQQEIVDGSFVPNAKSTIKKKKSSKPLIDHGHLRQSIHYMIRDNKEGGEEK